MTGFRDFYDRHERAIALSAFVAGFLLDVLTLPRVDSWLAIGQQALYIVLITAVLAHMLLEEVARRGAEQGSSEPRSRGPASGDATVEPIVSASSNADPTRVSAVSSQRDPLPPVDAPRFPNMRPEEARGPASWYRRYRVVLVHFLFGSLLNIYTIYYFKSASLVASFSFMLVLVCLLFANESRFVKTGGLALKFALLALCVLSFSAHVVPVFVRAIGPFVFLASMILGMFLMAGVAVAVAAWKPAAGALARSAILAPAGIVAVGFLAFYYFRLIPAVPLSMPFIGVYHGVVRSEEGYRLSHERPRWRFWHNGDQEFTARPGDRVYVFFRIYSPTRFSEHVLARWHWKDAAGAWALQDSIAADITGGRAEGFRGYGYKSNYRPGDWKVQVETTDGREIGRIYFRIETAPAAPRTFVVEVQ